MLTATPEEGRNFETYSLKCEGIIRIILKNVRRKGKKWYQLAQDGLQQPDLRICLEILGKI
jgi:hypothetical protein